MRNPLDASLAWLGRGLARAGVIDARRAERTVSLAWPRVVTGIARLSQRVVDFAMVGTAVGPAALAGLAFALAYWQVGNVVSIGVSGGTISQVSHRFGAGDEAATDRAVKQGLLLALAISLPLAAVLVALPGELVGLLGGDPTTTAYGAAYLQVAAVALPFEFANKVSSRALVGADDARTPMVVRGLGAVANVAFNAAFVFGLGMGVVGAALGTVIATALVTAGFAWGSLAGRLPGTGAFPIVLSVSGPYYDPADMRELVTISLPLIGRRLAGILVVFPLLAIAATFGPVVVAAFEVSRQIRALINAPNWGFSLAASSLVGQSLGGGDRAEALAYGRDVLRFAVVVFVVVSATVLVLARPVADVFVDGAATLDRTVPFVRVAAASAVAFGIDGAATGVLRGSGDTRWPFYGKLLGLYGAALPIAYLAVASPFGVVGPFGIAALYAALFAETAVPAVVTYYRYRTGAWLPRDGWAGHAPVD